MRNNMTVKNIEHQTNSAVTIEALDTDNALTKCLPQDQSPIFAQLPREIRDVIWTFATAPYEDEQHKYGKNAYYYRPDHTARLKTDTNLLLTCRRVWLEANAYPMLQAEHCFYYFREAPDARNPQWMADLTTMNRENFGKLHLFAQTFAIENLTSACGVLRNYFLKTPTAVNDFQPRENHVTLRHTDWYWWEHDDPLRFRDSWVQALLDSPDLRSTQTLKLELETLDYKADQLLPIVERLERLESREFETHIVDGRRVRTRFVLRSRRAVQEWSGPVDIDGQNFRPYRGRDSLNYYGITLTWRLEFPQIPRAHIPTVRRAPRLQTSGVSAPPQHNGVDEDEYFQDSVGPSDKNAVYFGRPMRRRDHKRLKLGMWPVRKQPWLEMLSSGLDVRMRSVRQANIIEQRREEMFRIQMAPYHVERWRYKWAHENSLLYFKS